jgi:hypothetical protein
MASELTDKTHVLVTRLGDFWVNQKRGADIMAIKMRDPNAQFEMDGSYITAPSVDGLLTAKEYNDLQCKRRGMWQCKWEQWHNRNDNCFCAQARSYKPRRPVEDVRTPLSPEKIEANKQRLANMRANLERKKMRKPIDK